MDSIARAMIFIFDKMRLFFSPGMSRPGLNPGGLFYEAHSLWPEAELEVEGRKVRAKLTPVLWISREVEVKKKHPDPFFSKKAELDMFRGKRGKENFIGPKMLGQRDQQTGALTRNAQV